MRVEIGPVSLDHSFTICPQYPLSLLGRDLLCKLGATIKCSPDGLTLDIPAKHIHCKTIPALSNQLYPDFQDLHTSLWGWGSTEVGFLKRTTSVKMQVKTGPPPCIPQYRITAEATEPIRKLIKAYMAQGVFRKCIPLVIL